MSQTYFGSSSFFLCISIFADPKEELQERETQSHSNSGHLRRILRVCSACIYTSVCLMMMAESSSHLVPGIQEHDIISGQVRLSKVSWYFFNLTDSTEGNSDWYYYTFFFKKYHIKENQRSASIALKWLTISLPVLLEQPNSRGGLTAFCRLLEVWYSFLPPRVDQKSPGR